MMEKRSNRSHFKFDGTPKVSYTEDEAVLQCFRLNSLPKTINQFVSYKCVKCGCFHIGHTHNELSREKKEEYLSKYNKLLKLKNVSL